MFLAIDVSLPLPAATAQHRMLVLRHLDGLQGTSSAAFADGRRLLIRAGGIGLSKQVLVQALRPYLQADTMVIPLRWVATGPTGALFPQLDANIEISPLSADDSRLQIIGSYRPPLGALGAGLDRMALHRVAEGTVRSLLAQLRAALLEPLPEYEADLVLDCPRRP